MARFGGSPKLETDRNNEKLFSLRSQLGYQKAILKASEEIIQIQDEEIKNNDDYINF